MNQKTRVIFELSKMKEFVDDIENAVYDNNNDLYELNQNTIARHGVNMCITQIGEIATRIREIDKDFYIESNLPFKSMVGVRNKIVHGYSNIDYDIVDDIIRNGIPELKQYLEENIHENILEDPYLLFDIEYDDYIKSMNEDELEQ